MIWNNDYSTPCAVCDCPVVLGDKVELSESWLPGLPGEYFRVAHAACFNVAPEDTQGPRIAENGIKAPFV